MANSGNPLYQEKYDFVFSIGEACSCSSTLRNAGLQHRSLPFDWVANPPLVERAGLFHSGFQDWLTKDAMECIGMQEIEKKPKMIYRNTITGTRFSHDFPVDKPFDEAFPIIKARYDRRIARLYETIRASRSVLMVYIAMPNETRRQTNEDLIEAVKRVSDCFPGVKIHLLYLFNDNNTPLKEAKIETPGPGIFSFTFCYNAFSTEVPYLVNDKVLYQLFHKIRMSGKHLNTMDSLNKWSAQHPILNRLLRCRVSHQGKQTIEIFRIRVCSFKAKNK